MNILGAFIAEIICSLIMSVGVLYPLAQIIHPDESKKYFIRYFIIRAAILIIGNYITTNIFILDFWVMIIGLIIFKGIKEISILTSNTKKFLIRSYSDYQKEQSLDENIPDLSTIFPDYKEETSENDKIIFKNNYKRIETLLDKYISLTIENKDVYVEENVKQINTARIILSLITFLNISCMCIYHRNFSIYIFIQLITVLIYRTFIKNMNIFSYIKKQLKARPDDNMNYIIASVKQSIIPKKDLISKYFLPITLIICTILFLRPHIIYEKKDDGYAVRYYTLGIFNESHVEIPDEYKGKKVTEIRGDAFANRGLEEIIIPEGVTKIRGRAFFNCDDLESVIIPSTLKEIESSAFENCDSLYNIKVPEHTNINEKAFKESPTRIERY